MLLRNIRRIFADGTDVGMVLTVVNNTTAFRFSVIPLCKNLGARSTNSNVTMSYDALGRIRFCALILYFVEK